MLSSSASMGLKASRRYKRKGGVWTGVDGVMDVRNCHAYHSLSEALHD